MIYNFRNKKIFSLILLLFCHHCLGKAFLWGEPTPWGVELIGGKESQLKLKLGTRLHLVGKHDSNVVSGSPKTRDSQDFYLRRTRFQLDMRLRDRFRVYMDIRNDSSNLGDTGEGQFNIGDGYLSVENFLGHRSQTLLIGRAKVDVSRTATVSSARILFVDRPAIADEASQFVNHNRRASNLTFKGVYPFFSIRASVGDGIQKSGFQDAKGNDLSSGQIFRQRPMVGAKLRFYPFSEMGDQKLSETYFGERSVFSVGVGAFHLGGVEYKTGNSSQIRQLQRSLLNLELTWVYRQWSLMGEYFDFNGVIQDFSALNLVEGDSRGGYLQTQYLLSQFFMLAPFIRFESWDRFQSAAGYRQNSYLIGINWYLQGENIRLSAAYAKTKRGSGLWVPDGRGLSFSEDREAKIAMMLHF